MNHHRCIGGRDLTNLVEDFLHCCAVANDVRDFAGVRKLSSKLSVFLLQQTVFFGLTNLLADKIQIERLGDEVKCASPHGLDSGFHGSVCSNDDRCRLWSGQQHLPHQFNALTRSSVVHPQ